MKNIGRLMVAEICILLLGVPFLCNLGCVAQDPVEMPRQFSATDQHDKPEDHEPLSVIRRPKEFIENEAAVGDLVEIIFLGKSDTGPFNLKIEVRGKAVFPGKPIVVLKVPYPPQPGEPSGPDQQAEVRAYVQAEGTGNAILVVTPVCAPGEPKSKPIEYRFKVAERGTYVQKARP